MFQKLFLEIKETNIKTFENRAHLLIKHFKVVNFVTRKKSFV